MSEIKRILQIGNPLLRKPAEIVKFPVSDETLEEIENLKLTLAEFRSVYGFGRAIAAPQIGVLKRMIAVNLGQGAFMIINPVFTFKSDETLTMWDDCMSFPQLLVRVSRHASVSVEFSDENGHMQKMEKLDFPHSELLQHEIDHLDGILAVNRKLDEDGLISRLEYDENRELYNRMVDYIPSAN